MDFTNISGIVDVLSGFFDSWQVKALLGLIVLDLGLGIAAALRANVFDFQKVALFYRTNVLPYILGFGVLFVAINYIMPVTPEGGTIIDVANQASVTVAWAALVFTVGGSIAQSFNALYQREPPSGT